jgi:DNA-binding transcriptional LysR family regulator
MLDFRIKTFLCVCQTMNYTQAAKRLNITQPAVSQHIRYLEDYYQIKAFLYANKKLELTPAGHILYERCKTMENDEVALAAELLSEQSGIRTLSLGVTMTVGEYAIIAPPNFAMKKTRLETEWDIAICAVPDSISRRSERNTPVTANTLANRKSDESPASRAIRVGSPN